MLGAAGFATLLGGARTLSSVPASSVRLFISTGTVHVHAIASWWTPGGAAAAFGEAEALAGALVEALAGALAEAPADALAWAPAAPGARASKRRQRPAEEGPAWQLARQGGQSAATAAAGPRRRLHIGLRVPPLVLLPLLLHLGLRGA